MVGADFLLFQELGIVGEVFCQFLGVELPTIADFVLWKFRCKVTPYVRSNRDPHVRLKMTPWT